MIEGKALMLNHSVCSSGWPALFFHRSVQAMVKVAMAVPRGVYFISGSSQFALDNPPGPIRLDVAQHGRQPLLPCCRVKLLLRSYEHSSTLRLREGGEDAGTE